MRQIFPKKKRNELIVCATFIEKVPNLAGLARTCEIMNAQCLLIENKLVTEDEIFKGISVTSEKWIPIHEVKQANLMEYLQMQKNNGFTIVGIEQSANSKMLNEFEFPEKAVLVLGKEDRGIPIEFIQILDACVEIPQFGVIRSLNVHVSGALCIWEYTRQMKFGKRS